MAKDFSPRKSKKERAVISLNDDLTKKILKNSDEKLLRGARLADVELSKITVRHQVRTKFNDESLQELAQNIKANGLIQPLVLHREGDKFVLICGERRFRAMNLIKMEKAPCFILEGKAHEELMAIQFSENSAREDLHYIDKADGIYNYQKATKSSERKIQQDLGISKSEVHRSLLIAKLSQNLKEAAKAHNIEKYVLLEFDALDGKHELKLPLEKDIIEGNITKRSQLKKRFLQSGVLEGNQKMREKLKEIRQLEIENKQDRNMEISAKAFIRAMNGHTKKLKIDKKTKEIMKQIIEETSHIIQK